MSITVVNKSAASVATPASGKTTMFVDTTGVLQGKDDAGTVAALGGGGSGDALTANSLAQFAATTSAEFRGVISDETGSGALVFANSPALTTPNIGSATGSISGNAGTATKLATARTINGVSFDGSANITAPAAAATLTGTTLPALNGAALTALNASNLASGTVAIARGGTGVTTGLTALSAASLTAGTIPDARFPATLPAASGVNLTALNASNLASGTVASARLGTGTADSSTYLRGDGTWNTPAGGGSSGNIAINSQTGTSYTLAIGDLGKLIRISNASDNTVTIPPNSSVAFAVGDTILVEQQGVGATTLAPGSGVTINTPPHSTLTLNGQRSIATLIKVGTNEWDISGALSSTEPVAQTVAIATADVPIDYSLGRVVKTTLGANISTFTITNYPASGTFASILWKGVADGTGRTITWSVNGVTAKWDGGAAPAIPSVSGREIWVQLTTQDAWTTVTALLIAASVQ